MLKRFNEYIKENKEPLVQNEISKGGKGVFKSFLKTLTSLGSKDISINYKVVRDEYIAIYTTDELDGEDIKDIFKRYKSLSQYLDLISKEKMILYFGIKNSAKLQYGIISDENFLPIGQFKLTNTTIKWILNLNIKSSTSLKKLLKQFSYQNLLTIGKIREDMDNFNIGDFTEKSLGMLNDDILSFGYKGYGTWQNGIFSQKEYDNLKLKLKQWLLNKKWHNKVQIKIEPNNFWINIHYKIK